MADKFERVIEVLEKHQHIKGMGQLFNYYDHERCSCKGWSETSSDYKSWSHHTAAMIMAVLDD